MVYISRVKLRINPFAEHGIKMEAFRGSSCLEGTYNMILQALGSWKICNGVIVLTVEIGRRQDVVVEVPLHEDALQLHARCGRLHGQRTHYLNLIRIFCCVSVTLFLCVD